MCVVAHEGLPGVLIWGASQWSMLGHNVNGFGTT